MTHSKHSVNVSDYFRFVCAMLSQSLSHVWSLQPHGLKSAGLLCPWNSPGENAGMGCHFLLWVSFQSREQTNIFCISRQMNQGNEGSSFFTTELPGKPIDLLWRPNKVIYVVFNQLLICIRTICEKSFLMTPMYT